MPYTLAQLEFLGVHQGLVVPPELLEKKRRAEEKPGETPTQVTAEKESSEKEALEKEAAKKEAGEKRKRLLDEVAKLTDPTYASSEALVELKKEREAATAALADEFSTSEQLQTAERAIAAFGEKVEGEKTRVSNERKRLLDEVSKLTDPTFAASEALAELKKERETASGALTAELPTSEQLQTAERAITIFGEKVEGEKTRVSNERKRLLDEVSKLIDPSYASSEVLTEITKEREAASGALTDEHPTPEQLQTAGRAIVAFSEKSEVEKTRVGNERTRLLDEVAKLTDPTFASSEALVELKKQREVASGALTAELPTAEELETAQDAVTAFGKKVEEEMKHVEEKKRELRQKVDLMVDPDFADADALKELKTQRESAEAALADALPTPAQLETATKAIAAFAKEVEEAKQRSIQKKSSLESILAGLTDPVGAELEEKSAMQKERQKGVNALNLATPSPANFKAAEKAIAALKGLIKQSGKMGALKAKNPEAAVEARKAFKDFRAAILDEEVTPEVVGAAKQEVQNAAANRKNTVLAWNQLNAVPDGETEQAKVLRLQKLQEAFNAYTVADVRNNTAIARDKALAAHEKALLGEKLLTEATDHGPLSGETGRPFKADTAKKLVQAFSKDPHLASTAVKVATTAKYPDSIANSIGLLTDKAADGFKSGGGTSWTDPGYARQYGENLLRQGGELGDEFFNRLPDYIASGKQFATVDLGDTGATTFNQLAQKRSVTLANKLVKLDGTIDLTSDGAKGAIGNLLFHPNAMLNRTPAMTASVLKTVKFLEDPVTGPQASNVLKATVKPSDEGAKKLVRNALGKGVNDEVSDTETRTAVLASMLKPLQQGPVGSCFSTAPTRRMLETKPLDAMKAFSDIASKGIYKPKSGVAVPVVTSGPEHEDPLHRSFEYTLATSAARGANSAQKNAFANNVALGADHLKTAFGGTALEWKDAKATLKNDVKAAFTFAYDPMSKVTDANDGSSSQGRYVVKRVSSGREITTREAFVEEMADVAIKSLEIDPNSDKATQIKDLVKQDAFVNAVCPGKYKPWELPSGGQTIEATKTLFGPKIALQNILPGAPKSPKPPEGERTTAVLNSFLNTLGSRPDEMVTVVTLTMHGFNAMPNHPSLADLKGANPIETASKVQTNLVDKGTALKNTDLSVERAAWLFDQELKKVIDGESDPLLKAELEKGAKAKRPTAAMKPADLTRAIKEASHKYHELVAEKRANDWKVAEENAIPPRPVAPIKLQERKTKIKGDFDTSAENNAKSLLIRDMGAPEFVIADTNWGSSTDHTLFVISPDPTTGEPMLWKKTEPPGSLQPAGREWVDDPWLHLS